MKGMNDMKLKYYGYKEAKVETRAMSIAELKLIILRSYMERGVREVQLIDLTCGETISFHSSEEVLKNEWCDNAKIEIINLPHMYGFKDADGKMDKDAKTIIIFQEAEEEENDKVIS